MAASDPTSALFEAARGYVAAFQPGRLAARVIVVMEDGKKAIDASVSPAPPAATTPSRPKLGEGDRIVLEAVAELGGAPTGAMIAEKSGYPLDSHLKTRLSLSVTRGLLTGGKGESGYSLTERACELLADES